MRFSHRLVLGGLTVLFLAITPVVMSQERQVPPAKVDKSGAVIVPLQGSVRLQMRNKKLIRSVFFDREGVVQVLPDATKPDTVIVFGRGVGTVNLELTDTDGGKESYEVVVQQDIDLLRNLIRRAVPTANVEVIPGVGGVLILSGNVARADDVDTILRIAAAVTGQVSGASGGSTTPGNIVNAMSVGGVHQVQLDVVVANVNRSKMRARGVDFIINGTQANAASILSGLTSISTSNGLTGMLSAGAAMQGMANTGTNQGNFVLGIIPAQVLTSIRALKNENLAKLLAEPKLVTQSGRPARFLAGGQQATISASSGINGPGVTYQPVGTELEFLPIVYGNGKIYLEVAPTVRGVNQGLGIIFQGNAVPGFDEQTVRTSVVLEPGQTFAIGGLIQNSIQNSNSKVPVLGELPFIGSIFSSATSMESEQELVILVTPHLVDAMDCNQLPSKLPGRETRQPDDFEFFLESMLELPRGHRNVFENRRYKAAWKNDPTATQFPCAENNSGRFGGGLNCGIHGANCTNGSCSSAAPVSTGSWSSPKISGPSTMPSTLPAPTTPSTSGKTEPVKPLGGTIDLGAEYDPTLPFVPVPR